ncbi:hypothetical protein BGZ94_001471 [Podila epigama]|nr:hypothetical protein BGZ94_001471 [Podila epigama]
MTIKWKNVPTLTSIAGKSDSSEPNDLAKVKEFLSNISHLQVVYQKSTLLSMAIRRPDSLLQGVQIRIDPAMVSNKDHFDFSIQLVAKMPPRSKAGRQLGRLTARVQCQGRASTLGIRPLPRSYIRQRRLNNSMSDDINKRLLPFIDNQESADIRFSSPAAALRTLVTMSGDRRTSAEGQSLEPARRLARQLAEMTSASTFGHFGQRAFDGRQQALSRMVKEVRFEDSVPNAIVAVKEYLYSGIKPVPQPLSGYTVKDLMELATYFGMEDLQDHCIVLALGLNQPWSGAPFVHRWDDIIHGYSGEGEGDGQQQEHQQEQQREYLPPVYLNMEEDRDMKSRQSAEILLQTLFTWGYRFPRMRQAVVRALCWDHGRRFVRVEQMLGRYRDHAEYRSLLVEMVASQAACMGDVTF